MHNVKNIINRIKRLIGIIEKNDNINFIVSRELAIQNMLINAKKSNVSIVCESNSSQENHQVIVSLTTYSKRIYDVHLVIESIAEQTVKPNKVILWLDEDEFTIDTIPIILKNQMKRGLDILFCPNYRSYKKLIPTLEKYPDYNIITIDDDIIYSYDMIEKLIKDSKKYPECIICSRAHRYKHDSNGSLLPYKNWDFAIKSEPHPSHKIFYTSGAGSYHPMNCFSNEVLNKDVFLTICKNADDVWFNAMAKLNNTKIKLVNDPRHYWQRNILIENSQDIGLFNLNWIGEENDIQIRNVHLKYKLNNIF